MTAPMWRRLADDLAHEIRSGQREPGSRLPSYVELAEKGYAQSTVTRAYQELTAQGLLVTVPGSGTFVVEKIPELARPIPEVLADHEARIAELELLVKQLRNESTSSGSDEVGKTS